jgi:mannose/cellobiose epimerase-like protein (N-acyl-D-glucosamine 2-epimerase family)
MVSTTSQIPLQLIEKSKKWLTHDVYPLWTKNGIDQKTGGFVESLTFAGEPMDVPRRAMVQSRQIYSMLTGSNLGCLQKEFANTAVERGANYMIEKFSAASGAFIYSINPDGSTKSSNPDLYTQAFALFGLAQAFSISQKIEYKVRAKELVKYLNRERRTGHGGYTELDENGNVSYKSNPHMHMFESAIAWMQIDGDQEWKELGQELVNLALTKFIDPTTHMLGEYFDSNWNHILENGRFVYEPGHQFEWAWLMSLYQELTGQDLMKVRHQLFSLANQYGTSSIRKIAFDEMWSNHTPKLESSRFWPQCERIKAAVRLGTEVDKSLQPIYSKAADDAMETLFKFFGTPLNGLWYDQLSASDTFAGNTAKASSLYHIVNAMEEYINLREKLSNQ